MGYASPGKGKDLASIILVLLWTRALKREIVVDSKILAGLCGHRNCLLLNDEWQEQLSYRTTIAMIARMERTGKEHGMCSKNIESTAVRAAGTPPTFPIVPRFLAAQEIEAAVAQSGECVLDE
jgi:hypothetical protein